MSKVLSLTGQKFGRLVVIKQAGKNKHGNYQWSCLCDCGKEKIVSGGHLRRGDTKSCGCLSKEKTIERQTKHGHKRKYKRSKTYSVWTSMIQRCNNTNHQHYKNYGGRGIAVCKRWKKFDNFLEDMGEVSAGLQIDRTDNNGNYCKSNCRWVTQKQNSRNRRSNRLIKHNGKTQCLTVWAEEFNISVCLLFDRLRNGWSMEKSLTTPIRGKKKNE